VQRWLVGLPLNSKEALGLRVHTGHTIAVCAAVRLQLILHLRSVCLCLTWHTFKAGGFIPSMYC
jgi:hypothetical protein